MKCQHCNSNETVYNDARGESICTSCGAVLTESVMVDQLTFTSSGAMTSQFVQRNGPNRGFAALYGRRESNEIALARGWANLERLAERMRMSPTLIEASKRLYHLALQRNFTTGRNNYFVVSSCLYAICRKEKSPFLLIDFSDALQTPVKTLAQVFTKLTRSLTLQVPCIDPSLYMERFASEMNLGAQTSDVAKTGVRLVQAMTRNWMVTGRRPLGLCGISLLIAATYHRISLNSRDVHSLFRVSSSTLEKRLAEFRHTNVALLPVGEFENAELEDLPTTALPPCLQARIKKLAIENTNSTSTLKLKDTRDDTKRLALEEKKIEERLQNAIICNSTREPSIKGTVSLDEIATMDQICDSKLGLAEATQLAQNVLENLKSTLDSLQIDKFQDTFNQYVDGVSKEGDRIVSQMNDLVPAHVRYALMIDQDKPHVMNPSSAILSVERKMLSPTQEYDNMSITATLDDTLYDELEYSEGNLDLDLDEEPVLELILCDDDRAAKAKIWDSLTRDVMPLVEERMRMKRRLTELRGDRGTVRRRRDPLPLAETAADSVKSALLRSGGGFKSKLNEDALNALFT